MSDKSKYPDFEKLGPSDSEMKNTKKLKPRVQCYDGYTPAMDNGPVAFGQAFKRFLK